jgi:Flp pilus assembly CpaF family ATPase
MSSNAAEGVSVSGGAVPTEEHPKYGQLIAHYGQVKIYRLETGLPTYTCPPPDQKYSMGPLQPLLVDDALEEVMYIHPEKCVIIFHRDFGMCTTNIFMTEEETVQIIQRIAKYVGKEVNKNNALLDGRLPNGSRVNATVRPASADGPSLTIRKFKKDKFTIIDLIRFNTLDIEIGSYLWMAIEGLGNKPANVLVSGGTGSGKTTTLNSIAMFIPKELRTITIEDTAELQIDHDHWIRLEAVPPSPIAKEITLTDLLKNSVRMRPDRIIVGEVRGAEANLLFTAMNTGIDGTMGTMHANTAQETLTRLMSPPMSVPAILLKALDLIVMQSRTIINGKPTRKITEIVEVGGMELGRPRINYIYKWNEHTKRLEATGAPSRLREIIASAAGISVPEFDKIQRERERVLKMLVEKSIDDPSYRSKEKFALCMRDYYSKNKKNAGKTVLLTQNEKRTIYYDGQADVTYYEIKNPDKVEGLYDQLTPLLEDDELEEVMYIDHKHGVKVVHRQHNLCDTNVYIDKKEMCDLISKMAVMGGKKADATQPILDATLPNGYRLNATLPPASPTSPSLTIRKFRKDPLTIVDLIKFNTLDVNAAANLWMWYEGLGIKPANMLIAGSSGCGKTSTLNIMAMFVPRRERVLTIEDTLEIQLRHDHWVRLESVPPDPETGIGAVTMDDLLKNTLRMRPDRIIVGEVRGPEAKTMFTAMNTGHDGSLGTVHANSAQETTVRLTNPPMSVPAIMMTGLNFIIMQQRLTWKGKAMRRVTEIAEMGGLEQDTVRLTTVFRWDPQDDKMIESGVASFRQTLCETKGISLDQYNQILEHRKKILQQMVKKNIRDIESVSQIIQDYYDKQLKK